jgi:hypothetical protein
MTDHTNVPIRFCCKCHALIDPARVARNSFYCGDDCRIQDKRERRQWKAGQNCRLCGRKARRPRIHAQPAADGSRGRAPGAQPNLIGVDAAVI